jgi:hypothetical protein
MVHRVASRVNAAGGDDARPVVLREGAAAAARWRPAPQHGILIARTN